MNKTVIWFLFLGLAMPFPGLFCQETPISWTREEPLSPSIQYHTHVIKEAGFNQKIHRIRVDLRSNTITAGISAFPDFKDDRYHEFLSTVRQHLVQQQRTLKHSEE